MPRQPKVPLTLVRTLQQLSRARADGNIDTGTWEAAYVEAIMPYHLAAYAHGSGLRLEALTPEDFKLIAAVVDRQKEFLNGYAEAWNAGYTEAKALPRDVMYADATKGTWWMGATRGYPLPAWPGDGTTQCKTHCNCSWRIVKLEGEGNADAYWDLGHAEHCQTCVQRSEDWGPLQIRDGDIQL